MLKIAENISRRRKEKNITQEELADFMMVTKASVSKWESGQSYPDILLLPKIATFFNITVDELIGYEPQLSTEQISRMYESFVDEITKENFDEVVKNIKSIVNQYYSCFKLLYDMGVLMVNHCGLVEEIEKRREYIEYANNILNRVCDYSNDIALTRKALTMRGVCLLQLGQAKEALEILPSLDELFMSTDCLVASAYLQTENDDVVDTKLQVLILTNITDLVNLLMMKSNLKDDNWNETCEKIEDLIQTFDLVKLNITMVLNFYLTIALHYNNDKNIELANKYIEKYLKALIDKGENSFEIGGDQYFNKIDTWLEENLILGNKPNRNHKLIYSSYLDALTKNKEFKNAIDFDSTKRLIKKAEDKLAVLNKK